MANCTVCNAKIGTGMFGGANLAPEEMVKSVQSLGVNVQEGLCLACFAPYRQEAKTLILSALSQSLLKLENILSSIEITTYPPGNGLDYEYCGLVSVQAAIGTGPVSQIISSWTDFFGAESGVYNKKLNQGVESCIKKIQYEAINKNANAIYSSHITYTELTSGQGMVLVCITGTAINVANGRLNIKNEYENSKKEYESLLETEKIIDGHS